MKGFGILRWDYANDHGDLHEHVGFGRKFWGEVREMPWNQAETANQLDWTDYFPDSQRIYTTLEFAR